MTGGGRAIPSMSDADDDADERLLARGERAALLARYYPVILERCRARLGSEALAFEAAHRVVDRLLAELARGRRYGVPYRVVVHQVVTRTLAGLFAGRRESPLPDDRDVAAPGDLPWGSGDPLAELESRMGLAQLFATLPERVRRVMEERYLAGRDPQEIAELLGMTRNAVDQAHHRGIARLRETWGHD